MPSAADVATLVLMKVWLCRRQRLDLIDAEVLKGWRQVSVGRARCDKPNQARAGHLSLTNASRVETCD